MSGHGVGYGTPSPTTQPIPVVPQAGFGQGPLQIQQAGPSGASPAAVGGTNPATASQTAANQAAAAPTALPAGLAPTSGIQAPTQAPASVIPAGTPSASTVIANEFANPSWLTPGNANYTTYEGYNTLYGIPTTAAQWQQAFIGVPDTWTPPPPSNAADAYSSAPTALDPGSIPGQGITAAQFEDLYNAQYNASGVQDATFTGNPLVAGFDTSYAPQITADQTQQADYQTALATYNQQEAAYQAAQAAYQQQLAAYNAQVAQQASEQSQLNQMLATGLPGLQAAENALRQELGQPIQPMTATGGFNPGTAPTPEQAYYNAQAIGENATGEANTVYAAENNNQAPVLNASDFPTAQQIVFSNAGVQALSGGQTPSSIPWWGGANFTGYYVNGQPAESPSQVPGSVQVGGSGTGGVGTQLFGTGNTAGSLNASYTAQLAAAGGASANFAGISDPGLGQDVGTPTVDIGTPYYETSPVPFTSDGTAPGQLPYTIDSGIPQPGYTAPTAEQLDAQANSPVYAPPPPTEFAPSMGEQFSSAYDFSGFNITPPVEGPPAPQPYVPSDTLAMPGFSPLYLAPIPAPAYYGDTAFAGPPPTPNETPFNIDMPPLTPEEQAAMTGGATTGTQVPQDLGGTQPPTQVMELPEINVTPPAAETAPAQAETPAPETPQYVPPAVSGPTSSEIFGPAPSLTTFAPQNQAEQAAAEAQAVPQTALQKAATTVSRGGATLLNAVGAMGAPAEAIAQLKDFLQHGALGGFVHGAADALTRAINPSLPLAPQLQSILGDTAYEHVVSNKIIDVAKLQAALDAQRAKGTTPAPPVPKAYQLPTSAATLGQGGYIAPGMTGFENGGWPSSAPGQQPQQAPQPPPTLAPPPGPIPPADLTDAAPQGTGLTVGANSGEAARRYNNPTSTWPNQFTTQYGSQFWDVIDADKNRIAHMPDVASGLAMSMQLLYNKYAGLTVSQAATRWSGNHRHAVAGYDPNQVITREWLDAGNLQPFIKSLMQGETSHPQVYTKDDWNAAQAYYNLGSAPGNVVGGTQVPTAGSRYTVVPRGGSMTTGGYPVGTPGAWVGPPTLGLR